eukprot:5157830-Lingulodinium_polyedra.AAC.1
MSHFCRIMWACGAGAVGVWAWGCGVVAAGLWLWLWGCGMELLCMHTVSVARCAQGLKLVGRLLRRPTPGDHGPLPRRWRRSVGGGE